MRVSDVFAEQIVTKRRTTADIIMIIISVIAGTVVCTACALVIIYSQMGGFSFALMVLMVAVLYLVFYNINSTSIEYEYVVTNSTFDIDRITAQKKRKRVLSVECGKIEKFGKYNPNGHTPSAYQSRVFACNKDDDNLYYFVAYIKDRGRTLVVFQPNDSIIDAISQSLTIEVKRSIQI